MLITNGRIQTQKMKNGMETEVAIVASTKAHNKLGKLNIFKNSNSCGSFRLIAFKTGTNYIY